MQKQEDEGKIHDAIPLIPTGAFSQLKEAEEGILPHTAVKSPYKLCLLTVWTLKTSNDSLSTELCALLCQ